LLLLSRLCGSFIGVFVEWALCVMLQAPSQCCKLAHTKERERTLL